MIESMQYQNSQRVTLQINRAMRKMFRCRKDKISSTARLYKIRKAYIIKIKCNLVIKVIKAYNIIIKCNLVIKEITMTLKLHVAIRLGRACEFKSDGFG